VSLNAEVNELTEPGKGTRGEFAPEVKLPACDPRLSRRPDAPKLVARRTLLPNYDRTCKLSASCRGMRGLNFQDLRVEHQGDRRAGVRFVGSARWHDCGAMTCRLLTFLRSRGDRVDGTADVTGAAARFARPIDLGKTQPFPPSAWVGNRGPPTLMDV